MYFLVPVGSGHTRLLMSKMTNYGSLETEGGIGSAVRADVILTSLAVNVSPLKHKALSTIGLYVKTQTAKEPEITHVAR